MSEQTPAEPTPVPPPYVPEVEVVSDQTAQQLRQVQCLGPQPLVGLAPRSPQFVSRSGPDPLATVRSQSDCFVARVHAGAIVSTGLRNGAHSRINYHFRRLKEYLSDRRRIGPRRMPTSWGPAGGLLLGRIRHPRIGPDLLGRTWACCRATTSRVPAVWACRWSESVCFTVRGIQAAVGLERLADRRVLGDAGREPGDGAGIGRRGQPGDRADR